MLTKKLLNFEIITQLLIWTLNFRPWCFAGFALGSTIVHHEVTVHTGTGKTATKD